MAVLHRAWAFAPESAHEAIATESGDPPDAAKMLRLARAAVSDSDPNYLAMIRFDPSWFEEDLSDVAGFYVVALGKYLTPEKSILHPQGLEAYLRFLGWSLDRARLVTNGQALNSLLPGNDDPLMHAVRSGLTPSRLFGGWLSKENVLRILEKLHTHRQEFLEPSEEARLAADTLGQMSKEKFRLATTDMFRSASELFERVSRLPDGWALRCICD